MVSNDPKSEGGLGVRDLPIIIKTSCVKKVSKCWSLNEKGSFVTKKNKYVKDRALDIITIKPNILFFFWEHENHGNMERYDKCLECRTGYMMQSI